MKSKNLIIMIIVVLVFFCGQLNAEEVVGYSIYPNIETPHHYPKATEENTLVWSTTIQEPGAAWIKIHFNNFRLNPNDYVELSDMNGQLIEQIKGSDIARKRLSKFKVKKNENRSANFWGPAIDGDKVIVELHRKSDTETDWGFTIDEVGVGCKPIFDIVLGPIYDTGQEENISIIPFCDSDSKIVKKSYMGNIINVLNSPLGRILYRKDSSWCTCNGFLSAFGGIYIIPNEPVIDCQKVVETTEVRFYCRYLSRNPNYSTYFTYYGDTFIDDYLSFFYGTLTIKNNHQWNSAIVDEDSTKKSPNLSKLYATSFCYDSKQCPTCKGWYSESCNCPCKFFSIHHCCGNSIVLSCDCTSK